MCDSFLTGGAAMEVSEGDDVFVRGGCDPTATNGLICLGVAVDVSETQVLVRFGDGSETLTCPSDVRPLGRGHELELITGPRTNVRETTPGYHRGLSPPPLKKQKLDKCSERKEPHRPPIILSIRATPASTNKKAKKTLTSSTSPLSIPPPLPPPPPPPSGSKKRLRPRPKTASKPEENEFDWTIKTPPQHVLKARKALPYDFDSLLWDENHQRNDKERYCYCGESGDWYKKMLQCDRCKQWFHQECIRSNALPALLLGDRFFEFVCTLCTGSDEETVRRKDLSWVDALHLALFNLTVTNNNKYHDVATSLIPFVKRRWKDLASGSSRLKLTKMSVDFVVSVLKSHKSRFRCGSAALAEPNNPMASQQDTKGHFWGLRKVAPPSLKGQQQTATVELKKLKNVPLSGVNSTMQQRRPLMKYPATGDKNNPSNKPTKRLNNKKLRVDSMDSALGQDEFIPTNMTSLDQLIPPPENFHHFNNPFRVPEVDDGPPLLLPEVGGVAGTKEAACSHHQPSRPTSRRFFTLYSNSSGGRDGWTCTKCSLSSSKTDSGFTTSPERDPSEHESVTSSNINDEVMACPPPLLDCALFTEKPPPTLDLFLHPSDLQDYSGNCVKTNDLNKFSLMSSSPAVATNTHRRQFKTAAARRLTLDGDIQYLMAE